jgi:hypothetical protein
MVEGNPYSGVEQRKEHRRKKKDQREEVRFEPDKKGRRRDNGRRITDADPWNKKVDD